MGTHLVFVDGSDAVQREGDGLLLPRDDDLVLGEAGGRDADAGPRLLAQLLHQPVVGASDEGMEDLLQGETLHRTLVLTTERRAFSERLPGKRSRLTESLTCSAEMRRISWRAFSMPSLVPVMRMLTLGSSGRGMAILVAVFSSSSCSFSPFLPITKRWCSLGMATVAEAWRRQRGRGS